MIVNTLPKIIQIPITGAETNSEEISLSNYRVATFILGTKAEGDIMLTVTGSAEDKTPALVPFILRNSDSSEFTETDAEGHTITHTGEEPKLWVFTITADMLSKPEFNTVTLTVTAEDEDVLGSLIVVLSQPRYTE